MRVAKTPNKINRHAARYYVGYGWTGFWAAVGAGASGIVYGTHQSHGYGMPWPVIPIFLFSLTVFLGTLGFVLLRTIKVLAAIEQIRVHDESSWTDYWYQTAESQIRQITDVHLRNLAEDLWDEIEEAARAMRHGGESKEEIDRMRDRYATMNSIYDQQKKLRQSVRTSRTLESPAMERVHSYFEGTKELTQ